MYKNILIATDGSELAARAVSQGLELAGACGSKATIVTVTDIWSALEMAQSVEAGEQNPVDLYEKAETEAAGTILDAARAQGEKAGVTCETLHVRDRHPAEGIIEAAGNKGCDLIVMASHGRRGIAKILLGSVASEVLTHSRVPILIVK
jgi:nucleotide-binding universal stress UspA family protein